MNTHLMLDFETLGTSPDTAVLSLGAVIFTPFGIVQEKEFHFNLHAQLKAKRAVSADTLTWWMSQGAAAKAVFDKSKVEGGLVSEFAPGFAKWVSAYANIRVWGNGASFDVPIIENMLNACGVPVPWKFFNIRCYRTIKVLFAIEQGNKLAGTKHNALDDARHQAQCLMAFLKTNPQLDQ